MTWEQEIAEIAKRRELAKALGGPEGVALQLLRGNSHNRLLTRPVCSVP